MTSDVKWMLYNNVESKRSRGKRNEPPPTITKANLHPKKMMVMYMIGLEGSPLLSASSGKPNNSNKYFSQLDQLKEVLKKGSRVSQRKTHNLPSG